MIWSVLAGFVLLLVGGEMLVRGSAALAERLGVPVLVIGIVVVGFGTSAPELVTSIHAALSGVPGIAIGNIVGSNIANILLILGAGAVICAIPIPKRELYRDGGYVMLSALLLAGAGWLGGLNRITGAIMVAMLIGYMWFLLVRERQRSAVNNDPTNEAILATELLGDDKRKLHLWKALGLTFIGIISIVFGGKLLVSGAVDIARAYNVSEEIIGLSVVAIGTSLPELATSVIAALNRKPEIALGNVLGSNVYNILGIGGITAMITPVTIPEHIQQIDIPLMLAISFLLLITGFALNRISRLEGGLFLVGYAIYLFFLLN